MMWYRKCVQVVELAIDLIRDMPLKPRDAFDDMKLDNTPPDIFYFIRIMLKDLQAKIKLVKKAQADDNG